MVRCGHCGNPLTATPNSKKYTRKDGTEVVKKYAKYRCSGKGLQKVKCGGQTTPSSTRLEGVVLDEVYSYLDQLEAVDLSNEIKELTKKNSGNEVKELQRLKRQLDAEQKNLSKYRALIIKVMDGESSYTEEDVSEMLRETKGKISVTQDLITRAESELGAKKIELAEMEVLQQHVPVWCEVFEQASAAKKKMMLSTIINSIRVHRETIEVDFKLRICQFIGVMGVATMINVDTGRVLSHSSNAAKG